MKKGGPMPKRSVILLFFCLGLVSVAKAQEISVGETHACANFSFYWGCWGLSTDGKTDVPWEIEYPEALEAGGNFTCALTAGQVTCWGNSSQRQTEVPKSV